MFSWNIRIVGFHISPAVLFGVVIFLCGSRGDLQSDIDNCRPQQVHLSYGESTAEVIVMWSTVGGCSSKVNFGTEPFGLKDVSPGESRLFTEPWNKQGAHYIHRVKLRNLPADKVIYYKPSSNDVSVGSFFFKTPPSPQEDTDESSIQFLTLGDLKTSSPVFSSLSRYVARGQHAAILHPGNLAINLSDNEGKNGDLYMKMMESSVKSVPYMTSPGPAESDNTTFSHYRHRFSMPSAEWPMTLDRMWYSIDIGPVHLISFSTEVLTGDEKYADTQNNWLIKDLKVANENRKRTPWIVAFGHRPMYCSCSDASLACKKQKSKKAQKLEDVMYHYGVDVIITSTGEGNEISYPMYKGVKVGDDHDHPLAPIHINVASASPWKAEHNSTEAEDWVYYSDDDSTALNFGRIQVVNRSLLRFEVVSFEGYKVLESLDIYQPHHGLFSKDDLPANISAQIDKQIQVSGGNPDVINIEETTSNSDGKKSPKPESTITKKIQEILHGDNRNKIIIGGSVAGVVLFLLIAVLLLRRVMRGRRRQSARRWENMDINYGKRYYNKAPDKEDDLENDFEIDMTETTAPSRKLLSDD